MGNRKTEKNKRRKLRRRQHEHPKQQPRMSFRDAMDLVPDDLPDGAFFAMAHEIAGLEYGEGFAELADDE